jgi:hypothetical protein
MTEGGELAKALSAAQGEFPAIERSRKVDTGKFSYSYAPLDAILAAVRPVLAKHQLALTQTLDYLEPVGAVLRTQLLHASGESVGGYFPLDTVGLSPQQLGSLLTYVRRYAIQGILGVAAEEDDDAGAAEGKTAAKPKPKRRQKDFQAPAPKATSQQLDEITSLGDRLVAEEITTWVGIRTALDNRYGTDKIESLTEEQAADMIGRLKKRLDESFDSKVY